MLNKFLKQDTKLLAKVQEEINFEIKRRNFRFDHEVFNVRHLTECPRRILYRANATVSETAPDFLEDNRLQYTKNKWVDLFSHFKKISILDRKVLAVDANYNIAGTVDAVFKYEDSVSTLLVDSLKTKEYLKAKSSGGLRKQIVELMVLTCIVEVENGVLLCENCDTNEYFLSHVILHHPILEGIQSKCKLLLEQKILHITPARPYDSNDGLECTVCEYREACWKPKQGD